jgi:hypothetical protein
MILSLCTLAMVGTAAAQNRLFSFARNKMMDNHEVSLNRWDDHSCSTTDLKNLAAGKRPGEEFDCITKELSLMWHCLVTTDPEPFCLMEGRDHLASPNLNASASVNLVTARSKGAVVSASTEGELTDSIGILGGPSCWVGRYGIDEWYQYSFNTTVSIVEVQTSGCDEPTSPMKLYKLRCLNNEGVWTRV